MTITLTRRPTDYLITCPVCHSINKTQLGDPFKVRLIFTRTEYECHECPNKFYVDTYIITLPIPKFLLKRLLK